MKALIAYGTGRGTTTQVAEAIADGLKGVGVDVAVVRIQYVAPARLAAADTVGIGCPVHFYREARYMTDFLVTLPRLDGKRAFVFCTCGMDRVGETLRRLHGALAERGAVVIGAESFRSAMSYFPLRRRGLGNGDFLPDDSVLAAARRFGELMGRPQSPGPITAPAVSQLTNLKARLLANRRFRKLYFPGIQLNLEKCTGYGSCLSRCLVNGLDRREGDTVPYVADSCMQCLECIAWCPRGAIEADSRFKEWRATLSYRLGLH